MLVVCHEAHAVISSLATHFTANFISGESSCVAVVRTPSGPMSQTIVIADIIAHAIANVIAHTITDIIAHAITNVIAHKNAIANVVVRSNVIANSVALADAITLVIAFAPSAQSVFSPTNEGPATFTHPTCGVPAFSEHASITVSAATSAASAASTAPTSAFHVRSIVIASAGLWHAVPVDLSNLPDRHQAAYVKVTLLPRIACLNYLLYR